MFTLCNCHKFCNMQQYDDVITWKYLRHYWPFVRGIQQSPAWAWGRWCFLWCQPQLAAEETVDLPVIWDTMMLMWCHCDANGQYARRWSCLEIFIYGLKKVSYENWWCFLWCQPEQAVEHTVDVFVAMAISDLKLKRNSFNAIMKIVWECDLI